MQEKQVSSGIGEAIEVGSEASERVAPGCSWELFDDEGGGVWAAGDASDVEVGGEGEGSDCAGGEAVWGIGEAQCTCEGKQSAGSCGGGEQGVCGARGEHGATVASPG